MTRASPNSMRAAASQKVDLEPLPPSADPARTAEYLARRADRMAVLAGRMATHLAGRPPVTLEIGCGHGHYLTAYAKAHPERFCVGIDLVRDRIQRATRKRDRAQTKNLLFLIAEARELLGSWPEQARLGEVFVLFPDPWPKRRHHKNRILQPGFLTELGERAIPGARLCFRTDHQPYFEEARAAAGSHVLWKLHEEPWPFELETVFQSRAPTYYSFVARRVPHL